MGSENSDPADRGKDINKRGQKKEGTKIVELLNLADTKTDFTEADIKIRNEAIISAFLDFLRENGLER